MTMKARIPLLLLLALWLAFSMAACCPKPPAPPDQATPTAGSATSKPPGSPTPTPTLAPRGPTPEVTEVPGSPTPTPTLVPGRTGPSQPEPSSNPCVGVSGDIEVRVLVGPADAAGLEPLAVGEIPFAVVTDEAPYIVEGAGHISYADILVEEWGTYEVTLDLDNTVSGECVGGADGAQLNVTVVSSGQQMVEVDGEDFHGEYPWSGTNSFDLTFPVVEGATAEGEGWAFVLHLHQS